MKFPEYIDILLQIIYVKFENDREKDSGYTECMKMEKKIQSDFSRLYSIVVLEGY